METTKPQVVSDAAEKKEAAEILKNEQTTQFVGNGRGQVADGYPLIPVGSQIFLKWNLKEDSKIIVQDDKARKPLNNYWEVVGIGAKVSTVNIGDKVILTMKASPMSFDTTGMDDIPDTKYHIIYEFDISAILA